MARNGGAKKIAVNGVYLISVLLLEHFDLISEALPFGPAVVRRAKRSQQCGRLREVSQSLTRCCDSRLR